jgi:predicted alpha/beta-hydrolase family hydrolase
VVASQTVLVLAPGAGSNQRHPFLTALAAAIASHGIHVVTFDFPYAAAGRRRPDPPAVLREAWRDVLARVRQEAGPGARVFAGGKSMGGRVATEVAAESGAAALGIAGIVCFGYPFHPPGRAVPRDLGHLASAGAPILILQGTRDAFGGPDAVRAAAGGMAGIEVVPIAEADHGFARPRRLGPTADETIAELAAVTAAWLKDR